MVHKDRMNSQLRTCPRRRRAVSVEWLGYRWCVLFFLWIILPRDSAFLPRSLTRFHASKGCPQLPILSHSSEKGDPSIPSVSDDHHQPNSIPVWQYSLEFSDWKRSQVTPLVAYNTWSWCQNFVLPLQLCPWARASLETPSALQMFLSDLNPKDDIVLDVGRRFQQFLKNYPQLESAAIFFIVFPACDFEEFYNWFDEMEGAWELMDDVIVAPFHPDWVFVGEPDSLQFEKRSPYPTVTLVSTRVVDKAGEEATKQISLQNEKTLLSKSTEELRNMWETCLKAGVNEIQ